MFATLQLARKPDDIVTTALSVPCFESQAENLNRSSVMLVLTMRIDAIE